MTTVATYTVQPGAADLVIRATLALLPICALTVVSLRMGRAWPWLAVLWGVFALVFGWLGYQSSLDFAMVESLAVKAAGWLSALGFASICATTIYLVVLAVAGVLTARMT